jgi:orotate phosphoribosyltransferase
VSPGGALEGEILDLLDARRGHFLLESGHHGDLWLELDRLFVRPARLEPFVEELGRRLSGHGVDATCGPLTGGAFLAEAVAAKLDLEFSWAERSEAGYRIPEALREGLEGKAVAIVDDVVNAASAAGAALEQLRNSGARPVAIGALVTLGATPEAFAVREGLVLERLATLANTLWDPAECPMCAAGEPLERPG